MIRFAKSSKARKISKRKSRNPPSAEGIILGNYLPRQHAPYQLIQNKINQKIRRPGKDKSQDLNMCRNCLTAYVGHKLPGKISKQTNKPT